ncbi:MAG: hypothetical protein NZ455_08270 [Bacteroidia bacterium]|nr:hypothetical protein [Bacteroidia bacterium]MDW8348174.1 hypothetical protein [Bacteroidia bacterium]
MRQHGAKPSPTLKPLPRGWAGGAQHRSDSAARSTPTLPARAQRDVGKDTPIIKNNQTLFTLFE